MPASSWTEERPGRSANAKPVTGVPWESSPGGYLIGQADLLDVQGPFTVEELLAHPEKHLAEEAFLRAYAGEQPLYAWVLHNAFRYEKPLFIPKKPGRVMFVDLSEVWP